MYTAWPRLVTPVPPTSLRTNVHPAGAVTTGAPITSTTATNTSPNATPTGRGNTNDEATPFTPDDAERNTIPVGAARTVAAAVAMLPLAAPSFGVTSTVMVSPASPFPLTDKAEGVGGIAVVVVC